MLSEMTTPTRLHVKYIAESCRRGRGNHVSLAYSKVILRNGRTQLSANLVSSACKLGSGCTFEFESAKVTARC